MNSNQIFAQRWNDRRLENKPGEWKPVEQPFRVVTNIRFGNRYDQYRSVVRTFATEAEAREYAAKVPAPYKPRLYVAVNPETWSKNGSWRSLAL